MQKSENSVSKETPKTRTPKTGQKKKSSQKPLQKWFKGSPKSRSSQKAKKLLKSPPVEKTPQKPPTPPGVVDFDFDGSFDRVSVFDALPCTETDENIQPDSHVWDAAGLGTDSVDNSCGSAKETPKSRTVPHKKDSHKKNKLPVNRNLNKSLSDADARRKSPPVCKLPEACFDKIQDYKISEAPSLPIGYIRYMEVPQEELADEVEYDLDGEDFAWLSMVNEKRKDQNLQPVKFADMELLMDRLEKESYFQVWTPPLEVASLENFNESYAFEQMQSTGIDQGALIDDDAVCCICMDGECQNSNAILFCDMCNLAVHQECYGVPYIPEGQWLCRRCLQSPSRAVDCALCPNKGGAFKQTDDGRWAHVVCAIWIPEVCFANTVFLEPVDSIGNIPPARWRLVCFICKQKGVGACIQCHKSNCYVAFHVTCAQQAGLCMKMDTVRESSSITVKKTAYCDNHAPPDSDFVKDGDGTPSPRQKMRQARKLLAEKRSAVPVLSIPTIPDDRVAEIAQTVAFARKSQFIKRLMAYWKLKRQSRNGVPLLRRLQAASTIPHPPTRDGVGATGASRSEESQTYYRYWLRLRQDLERARLLCELVRKREKVKKELIHLKSREMDIRLRPFCMFLINVLEEIQAWDTQDIFAQPVDVNEVPDYLTIVTHPMDLETMREKINSFEYNNIDEFEADFSLMIENCLNYNSKDTIFYRAGVKLREQGGIIIRHARRSIDAIGFDTSTGLHLPERKHIPIVLTDDEILQKVDNALSDDARFDLPFDKHLEMLNEILDDTLALTHPTVRKKKFNKVKHEIVRVRRLKHSKLNRLSSTSPLKQKYKRRESVLTDSETEDVEDVVAGTEIKTKQRSNKSLRPSSEGLGSPESGGKRELRLSKRKREPSPPAASPTERSPSPPVLRGSKITGREKARCEKVKAPTPKKTRRASSSGESASTPLSTPNKSKKFNSISEEGTQNDDDDTKNPRASPPALPSTPSKGGAGARLLRDREPSTDKVQVLSSSSSSSPVKTPSKSSGVNRRNTVLLTKKINATQQQQQQQQQQETPNSSPNKTAVTPGKTPKKGSPKKSLPNNVNAASSNNNNNNKNKKNPPTRNSARLRNFTNNNSVTINNNNVISNSVSWPHDGFHNNDNSSVNFNNNTTTTTTRTTDGLSPSGTPPWNSNSVSESVVVAFDKDHHHHHHLNRHHRNNSSDLPLNSSSSPSKRKKKVNSPLSSAYKVGAGDVTSLRNSSSNTSGSDILNNGLSGFSSARVPGLNSTRSSHVKSDSFSVYRSGKDLELNSEDEEEDEEKDEDEDKEEDDDDEGPENSDNASSDNDESVDGSHDSGDESSSSNSKKSSSSSSSSSDSESDSSYQSSSTTRRGKYDMRRKRNENSVVNHSRRSENNSRVLNDIHQGEDDEEVEDEEDEEEEEEEGLITERSHGRVSNNKYRPQPLDLVWAKTKDFSWYPATIINPDTPLEASQNDVQIPVPPSEILSKRPRNSSENNFLVLCFDAKRTWEWISRNHLEPLGLDPKTDQEHLMTRKVDKRTLGALRKAYEKALLHRNRLNGTDGRIHGFPA